MTLVCETCGGEFERRGSRGPIPLYCDARCNHTAWRRRQGMAERTLIDPEDRAWAARERQRRRRGYQGRVTRPIRAVESSREFVDPAPFVEWFKGQGRTAEELGIDATQMARILSGEQKRMSLDMIDAALLKTDVGLWELYP